MSIQETVRYGAAELKRLYNRNLSMALGISVGFHALLILLYMVGINIGKAGDKPKAPISAKMKLENIAPPPEAENTPPPPPPPMIPPQLQNAGSGNGGVAARAGNPVAVPDALIAPEVKDFPTTADISVAPAEGGDGTGFSGQNGDGLGAVVPTEVKVETKEVIPDPDEFVAVEEQPDFDQDALYKRLKYPEMARRNNIEGRVTVQVYVDKTGKPVKFQIAQSDNKILEQAAIDAVMGTSFKPAIQNKTPIGVWISIPITFKLN
jgi:protein TonB